MAAITPEQAIKNAIEAELASARFYTTLASNTEDLESKRFFEQMATGERGHARAIEEAGRQLVSGPLPARADGQYEVIETVPEWTYIEGVTLLQALDVAHAAESQAALFYDALADCFDEPEQSFFRTLARTEEQHAEAVAARRRMLRGDGR